MDLSPLRPLLGVAAAVALVPPLYGQGAEASRIPPLSDTTLARIAGEVSTPPGFELSVFAAPPHLTYPVAVHPAGDGVVYVATDPNLLFGRERHLGRILRFVDLDGDGAADRVTVFADSLDSVRGLTVDRETVYVMHAPTLAAYRDRDGDGRADEKRTLVEGLGFGLDDRNGDHTSNGIRLGVDGWIYIAVGDYGFLAATGTDATQIHLHGGGVVRVRPDGTELEIVATGTRNIYDIALDSHLRLFARDNNNNGQGWNSRFHYLPVGADAGYPSHFRNFPEEIHDALADFGAGAATTALWIDEPFFPDLISPGLVSADWALNRVFRHELAPEGASFRIRQEDFISIPRPVDLEVDADGNLFVASLSGGSYDYAGEHVGYVVRLRPAGGSAAPAEPAPTDETGLVEALLSSSRMRRLEAQRELIASGGSTSTTLRLREALADHDLPLAARIVALFTLKQMAGSEAHPVLVQAATDPALRAMALRALSDRRGELEGVPPSLFAEALGDPDPFVRLHAVRGLARVAPTNAPELLMSAATDRDATVAHVARNALAAIGAGAADAALQALDTGDAAQRDAALRVLARLHSRTVVSALIARLKAADPGMRLALLGTLARLHHREGFWDGAWWGNQPSTEGPYFNPVRWEESPRIRSLLVDALVTSTGPELMALLRRFEREGVIPRESAALLATPDRLAPADRRRLLDTLVGGRELRPEATALLLSIGERDPAILEAVGRILVALPSPPAEAARLVHATAAATQLPVELRARALAALGRLAPAPEPREVDAAFAAVLPELSDQPALLQVWRRYVGDRARVDELEHFLAAVQAGTGGERTVGYAVLVQVAGLGRNPAAARERAAAAIASAWGDHAAAEALVRAIEILGVEERYADELARHRSGSG